MGSNPAQRFALLAYQAAFLAAGAQAAERCSVRSGERVVPLVELYTSEGCSSCPPADRWLSRQIRDGSYSANWLAFHVDYWDQLGWPDRFASPAYAKRQHRRVEAGGGSTVYTPQVMVGDEVQVPWHSEHRFARVLADAGGSARAGLAMILDRDASGTKLRLGAARDAGGWTGPAMLWLAQTIDGQRNEVRAGENEGAILRHDRVVTRLWGPWPLETTPLVQTLHLDLQGLDWGLTAVLQDPDGRVLQSLRLAASDCR